MDLGYPPRQPIQLYYDNKASCNIAHSLVQHDRTKHVEDQLVNILTKVVSSQVLLKFLDKS
ncbi:hypothetical protein CR513_20404, partial [Mucuna pruriens]